MEETTPNVPAKESEKTSSAQTEDNNNPAGQKLVELEKTKVKESEKIENEKLVDKDVSEKSEDHSTSSKSASSSPISSYAPILPGVPEGIEHPLEMITEDYVTYSITRTEESAWYGKRVFFQFYQDDYPMFCSKVKAGSTDPIPIIKGPKIKSKDKPTWVMLANTNMETFSLRRESAKGKEILLINMYQIVSTSEPKNIQASFFMDDESPPVHIVSRPATKGSDGKWYMDFSGRYAVESIRNFILIGETDRKEFFTVRKVDKGEIEIDSLAIIPPIFSYVIGLAAWLSPI